MLTSHKLQGTALRSIYIVPPCTRFNSTLLRSHRAPPVKVCGCFANTSLSRQDKSKGSSKSSKQGKRACGPFVTSFAAEKSHMHYTTSKTTLSPRRGRPPRSPLETEFDPVGGPSTDKPSATFTSSLSIPVQGVIPIDSDSREGSVSSTLNHASQHHSRSASKRAPRKSKTEAMAALYNHTQSSSAETDEATQLDPVVNFYPNGTPIPVSSVFDLNSVRTSSPRKLPANMRPRPFGLQDCPVFYPTLEEFKDPMAYVRSISETAKNYGICKVVPPEDWKMPFITDSEVGWIFTRPHFSNCVSLFFLYNFLFLTQCFYVDHHY